MRHTLESRGIALNLYKFFIININNHRKIINVPVVADNVLWLVPCTDYRFCRVHRSV